MPDSEYINKIKGIDPSVVTEIFERGLKEGFKHTEPSPETALRLNRLETDVKKLTEAFTQHSKEVIEHSERRDEHLTEMMLEFREGMRDVKQIKDFLTNSTFTANVLWKIVLGIGALITFALSTYLMVKQGMQK